MTASRSAGPLRTLLMRGWRAVRQWCGDAAYETYLSRAGDDPLSAGAFYLEGLERKYGQPNRCC